MELLDRFLPARLRGHHDGQRLSRILVGIAFAMALVSPLGLAVRLMIAPVHPAVVSLTVLITAIFLASPWILWRSGSLRLAGGALTAGLYLLILSLGWFGGGLDSTVLIASPLVPMLAVLLLGLRAGAIVLAFLLAAIAGFVMLSQLGLEFPQPPLNDLQLTRARALSLGLTAAVGGLLAALSERARRDAEVKLRRGEKRYRGLYEQSRELAAELERQTRELAQARDTAIEASRAKSRFLSMVSHELRTPLVGVVGAIDLLNESELTPQQREWAEVLNQSARAQLEVIGNVLDFSRIEAGEIDIETTTVSPRRIVEKTETLFRTACRDKGLELLCEVAPDVPDWIAADATRVRQVLTNLVGNALKFTDHGSISIRAGMRAGATPPRLEIEVADTGIGIAVEHVETIFESFRQGDESTARRFGGSGLGLAISRRLVAAMGGEISVVSSPGHGSTFRFDLPAPAVEPPAGDEASIPETEPALTVLIADDDQVNRTILSSMLKRLGHRPVVAEDGRRALELAASVPVDVIILDVRMPELDGPRCARAIRSLAGRPASLPILGLTGDAVTENRGRYLESGFDQVYSKPIRLEGLRKALAEAVATRHA